jgi:predicted transcriptional regulator YheO
MRKNSTPVTAGDMQTLKAVIPLADGVAALLGPDCEVALHSFENLDKSIIHIVNGHITGRKVGSPITDLGVEILNHAAESGSDVTGPYHSKTVDGKNLRSVSILIRGEKRKAIGMLCINFNLSVPLDRLMANYGVEHGRSTAGTASVENYTDNIEGLIRSALEKILAEVSSQTTIPNNEKNKQVVAELNRRGIFGMKGAVDMVARELAISRYTIYNYLRGLKVKS